MALNMFIHLIMPVQGDGCRHYPHLVCREEAQPHGEVRQLSQVTQKHRIDFRAETPTPDPTLNAMPYCLQPRQ